MIQLLSRKRGEGIGLFFFISLIFINVFFLKNDDCLPIDHVGYFSTNAMHMYYSFQNLLEMNNFVLAVDPPLIGFIQGLFFKLVGVSFFNARIVPLLFYLVLVCIAYGVGLLSSKSKIKAVFLAFIVAANPYIILQSKHNVYPFYSMVFLFVSFFVLLLTARFSSFVFSVLLGCVLGCLLLTHEVGVLYYGVFVGAICVQKKYFLSNRKAVYLFVCSLFLSLFIGYVFWYRGNILEIPGVWMRHLFVHRSFSENISVVLRDPIGMLVSVLFQQIRFLIENLNPLCFFMFFVTIIFLCFRGNLNPFLVFSTLVSGGILVVAIVIRLVGAELFHWHFIGMYPFLCVIIFYGIEQINYSFIKKIMCVLVVLIGIFILGMPLHKINFFLTPYYRYLIPHNYSYIYIYDKSENDSQLWGDGSSYLNSYFLFCCNIDSGLFLKMNDYIKKNWNNPIHDVEIYLYKKNNVALQEKQNYYSTEKGYKNIVESYCKRVLSEELVAKGKLGNNIN